MRLIPLALLLGTSGCKIIIGHDDFYGADGATTSDSSSDTIDAMVREGGPIKVPPQSPDAPSSVSDGRGLVYGRAEWSGGGWELVSHDPGVASASLRNTRDLHVTYATNRWTSTPYCVCEVEGGGVENTECALLDTRSTPAEVTFTVWSDDPPVEPHPINFACVGPISNPGATNDVSWVGDGPLVIAGARRTTTQIPTNHGAWVQDPSGPVLDLAEGIFREPPICFAAPIGRGRFGTKVTTVTAQITTTPWITSGETGREVGEDVICIGRGAGTGASRVVSPASGGAVLTNVTTSPGNTTGGNGGGDWTEVNHSATDVGTWTLPYKNAGPYMVTGEPQCIGTPIVTATSVPRLGFELVAAPSGSSLTFRIFDATTDAEADEGLDLMCIAPRNP